MTSQTDAADTARGHDERIFSALEYLNRIGVALSQEKDINRLLETILIAAKTITHADGGTLYRLVDGTTLRDHILKRSQVILQDDTGVPLKLYKAAQWEHRLYGAYVGPIPIFRTRYQPEMSTAYRDTAHPLGFGIGYRYESHESNLQLFVRRTNKVVATGGRPTSMN